LKEFHELKNGQRVRTKKKAIDALVDRVKEHIVEGWLLFNRGRRYRASWDLEGNILPNKLGFGSEFSLSPKFD